MDDLLVANDRLKEIRRQQGLPETGQPTRMISTTELAGDFDKCWKHRDQDRPCPICAEEEKEQVLFFQERAKIKEEERLQEEERKRQDLSDHPEAAMTKAGVGRRFLDRSFETFQGGQKYATMARECAENPHDLVMWGTPGSGKTHLAVSILREVVRRGGSALFVTVPELLLEIRNSFSRSEGTAEDEIISRYCAVPLLILDDLGAEKTTEYSITTLYLIIDRRYREEMPTVVTTNLSPPQIEHELGARIASRLAGMRIGEIKLPDFRKRR